MGFTISKGDIGDKLGRYLEKAQDEEASSIEKMASGDKFAGKLSQPSERALATKMEQKIRSLSTSKKDVNDAVSLLQTADSSLQEIGNILTRMREINISATSTTMNDDDRKYMFIEYQALYDEVTRISTTTEYNGLPLLYGKSDKMPDTLYFRLDDPALSLQHGSDDEDPSIFKIESMKNIDMTSSGLLLNSAKEILADTSATKGISQEDAKNMMSNPDMDEGFTNVYDYAFNMLSCQRATFGAAQSRLNRVIDFIDVYQENIDAARSKIADTDYAEESSKLMRSKMMVQASSSLMAQSNMNTSQILHLLNSL